MHLAAVEARCEAADALAKLRGLELAGGGAGSHAQACAAASPSGLRPTAGGLGSGAGASVSAAEAKVHVINMRGAARWLLFQEAMLVRAAAAAARRPELR